MNKHQKKVFKSDLSRDLKLFGKALFDAGLIHDKKVFETAANQCINGPLPDIKGVNIDYANSWGYEIPNLQIIFTQSNPTLEIFPKEVSINSINIASKVIGNFTREDYAEDPLSHLEFNLTVQGIDKSGDTYISSWHLDRQPDKSDSISAHPAYHFQYGGKRLSLPNNAYGRHLVLDSPRLVHPPLDIILGVDFVLSNFFGEQRQNLCAIRPYTTSVSNIQRLIWRPYTHSVARNWPGYPDDDSRFEWECVSIYPQILNA
ncbi:hypothetical protein [Flagellimonas meridianipacifica]|uniref:Uncharacterized protein n=1 Tax=Flagellimonas meridianipacifica TaxID=1080225 RepID=A0A2T0MIF4_9FLAO|nr:hypothetical protein [Allomuricauda pacifica]PRX57368.1 hypothetical protein CLV81_1372 [Allomuricauda pacifica]